MSLRMFIRYGSRIISIYLILYSILFSLFFFFFLAMPWGLWDLSSAARDWTQAIGSETAESQPLDHHRILVYSCFLTQQENNLSSLAQREMFYKALFTQLLRSVNIRYSQVRNVFIISAQISIQNVSCNIFCCPLWSHKLVCL